MKRILSLVLVIVMLSSCCVFAQTLDEVGMKPWTKSPFLEGLAGSYPESGVILVEQNGVITWLATNFKNPTGLATDEDGSLYISDTGTGIIYRILTNGKMEVFCSDLFEPAGICWSDGKLYVAESGKNRIVVIDGGETKAVAGRVIEGEEKDIYEGGYVNGSVSVVQFDHPQGVAVAGDGRIFVADTNNHVIRMIRDGRVYTISDSGDLASDILKPAALSLSDENLFISDLFTGNISSLDVSFRPFQDVVSGVWYETAINEAALCGITHGMGDGSFFPSVNVTRSQFVCFIANLYLYGHGNAVINGESEFDDLQPGIWYEKQARWACDMGIALGYAGKFNGDALISRQELVTMLYRYADVVGLDTSLKADLSSYPDHAELADYAEDAFAWAVACGVIEGFPDGSLRPAAGVDRAQACVMMTRIME